MSVKLTVNGKTIEVADGTTVATAVYLSGAAFFRRSEAGQPRAPLCGMGICFECRVTIDGRPHQRSCLLSCRQGMEVKTDG